MKPSSVWIGIVLLAVGVCGLLDAAGVVASRQTIGLWWPLAIVGSALADMVVWSGLAILTAAVLRRQVRQGNSATVGGSPS